MHTKCLYVNAWDAISAYDFACIDRSAAEAGDAETEAPIRLLMLHRSERTHTSAPMRDGTAMFSAGRSINAGQSKRMHSYACS